MLYTQYPEGTNYSQNYSLVDLLFVHFVTKIETSVYVCVCVCVCVVWGCVCVCV
jgi:hypothetical protein